MIKIVLFGLLLTSCATTTPAINPKWEEPPAITYQRPTPEMINLGGNTFIQVGVVKTYYGPSVTGESGPNKISGKDLSKYIALEFIDEIPECAYLDHGARGEIDNYELYTYQCNPYGLDPTHRDGRVKSNQAWRLSQIHIKALLNNPSSWK